MKNIAVFLIFTMLTFIHPPTHANTKVPNSLESVSVDNTLGTRTICWFAGPLILICVTIDDSFKVELPKDFKLKATLSKDGQSLGLSGFPPDTYGQSFSIKRAEFSGFTFKEQKRFVQPGKYQISKGRVSLKLGTE